MKRKVTVITLLLIAVSSAGAAENEENKSCVSVAVNGIRTVPYACLSQQLTPPEIRNKTNKNEVLEPLSVRRTRQPAHTLGLYNHSATSVRMGANFGHSALSQRPAMPQNYTPLLPAR